MQPLREAQEGMEFRVVSKNSELTHCFKIGDIIRVLTNNLGTKYYNSFRGPHPNPSRGEVSQAVSWDDLELCTEPTSPLIQLYPLNI